ncbi:cyanidin 3-O-rutinoside 5-O-glucosyltransferase-like [Canna indica]|uniref:Glycosyltransferase n=1 Tax=Canna indica TaxID=4628 RepID=A0AAQ3KTF6_9LILI|nr:cyanidin 3-O-rutinoside 5-O-glucosyltransferase-like [Canna indica]
MEKQHFLVVTYAAQGHVNPALNLCRRIARSAGSPRVTFSTSIFGHRRLFPKLADDEEVHDGLIFYVPFSDGYDDGFKMDVDDNNDYQNRIKTVGSKTLAAVLRSFEECGRPVTCLVYNMLLAWVGDLAREYGIRSAVYWIQPATVFAAYYHYFHGYDGFIASHRDDPLFTVNLPGLPQFKIRDLPSFIVNAKSDDIYAMAKRLFQDMFDVLDRQEAAGTTATVLVNTFDELEADALVAAGKLKLIPIGPMVPSSLLEGTKDDVLDLFKPDVKQYMEWLDSKPKKSVVYVSFGSLTVLKQRQAEEILRGLRATGRPYLWVVRKDNRAELEAGELKLGEEEEDGMVVEWCSQARVLSHPAVGCFVTHCGWNSTVEALACGMPTVAVPQWTDQATNAKLMEICGIGVRAEVDAEGAVEAAELRRCVETVMQEGERAEEMRRRAEMWKDKARVAVGEGGSSDRNLRAFVEEMASSS